MDSFGTNDITSAYAMTAQDYRHIGSVWPGPLANGMIFVFFDDEWDDDMGGEVLGSDSHVVEWNWRYKGYFLFSRIKNLPSKSGGREKNNFFNEIDSVFVDVVLKRRTWFPYPTSSY